MSAVTMGFNSDTVNERTNAAIAEQRARHVLKPARQQFGESFLAMAKEFPQLVAVTADLMNATGLVEFGATYPERMINVGIAEQNLVGVTAGLASCGKLSVAVTYASFLSLRAIEQVKVDCAYNGVKVILVGMGAGLSYGVGGPTHQTYEDVAVMRAIPNMIVLAPSDTVEMDKALRACIEQTRITPIFLRLGRGPEYVFNAPDTPFEIGKAVRLREGDDLCIVANGAMVFEAVLAADALALEGIRVQVLNMHTVKPIDREALLEAAARVRGMLVVEEHNVLGGLGSAVLEVLDQGHRIPVQRIGIEDAYPPIGPTFELRAALGLCAENMAAQAKAMLKRVRV
ncbi:transketolase C-terminal domain-containing protein [Herbaspirillum sp. RTI4]|uniref:transketolase family protein n=1 Tax=Herbaspirillum sp. RTI4 TaxID=3048640 RepID=UPI002AB386B1|nr:transketolase C-terminal domain-containing protein [Herbaspirillum sp. RTI4]MDY7579406.1 transketolase C-terminal domain-containing protein [Herbaspirillum sp. RTI4]MEA9980320.1 transketolase C-terminal domain-containing protein [Herbaspirillum sp. RTI4]